MSGEKNLIPMNERSPEEQKRIATMGGIASGVARREKKKTLDMLEAWLAKSSDNDCTLSNEDAYIRSVIRRGIKTGDTALMELTAKLRGELVQKSELDVNGAIPTVVMSDEMIIEENPENP